MMLHNLLVAIIQQTGGFSFTASGVIAMVLAIIAIVGHVASGIYFLVRWNTMVKVMKVEISGTKDELHNFRSEVKEDMAGVHERLDRLSSEAREILLLRERIEGIAGRLRRVEDRGEG